jgi:hypothetical protein
MSSYCKYITKNHCNDDKCLERHTKTLFVNPFIFYVYFEVEDSSYNNYYTYDFVFYYIIHCYSDGKVYNNEKIYKHIFEMEWNDNFKYNFKHFDNKVIDYINLMRWNYDNYFEIFILISKIISLKDVRDIIYENMQLNKYFQIKCDA